MSFIQTSSYKISIYLLETPVYRRIRLDEYGNKHQIWLQSNQSKFLKSFQKFLFSELTKSFNRNFTNRRNCCNWHIKLFSELTKSIAYRILLTIRVTVNSVKRSFSKLRLIKSYLRSTMLQERLNGLAILSIKNEMLKKL